MSLGIHKLVIEIVRFVDDDFPGWVECQFVDAEGSRHNLVDKVPIFTQEELDATTQYPLTGVARCEVLDQWRDARGRELARINTASPDGIESAEGLAEFVVLSSQLVA